MKKKKLLIAALIVIAVLLTCILTPALIGASNDQPAVTRLYSESLEGPWSNTSSHTTRWVQDISVVNGQTTVVINEVHFIWEAPTGTLVFTGEQGQKGDTGPEGPQGPRGPQGPGYIPQG
jgi:hypothetical protein